MNNDVGEEADVTQLTASMRGWLGSNNHPLERMISEAKLKRKKKTDIGTQEEGVPVNAKAQQSFKMNRFCNNQLRFPPQTGAPPDFTNFCLHAMITLYVK